MTPAIPGYITAIVLVTNVVIAVSVWGLVSSAAGRTAVTPEARRTVRLGIALFLGGWPRGRIAARTPAGLAGRA